MSLLEELLAPIEGESPAGPDLRSGNEFAEIEKAFLDADQPSTMSVVDADADLDEGFDEVVELASEFLQSHSKDLKVAVFLTAALMRVESFKGLADGLEVIKGLLTEYWDTLYPGIPSRAPILDWFGSDDLSYAVFLLPLTDLGHRLREYKEWVAAEEAAKKAKPKTGAKKADDEGSGDDFESAFGQTSREWYEELVDSLNRCNETLAALDALGKEKFKEADEKPPRYADLAAALKRMTSAAADLLGRKPAPPKPAVPDTQPETAGEPATGGASAEPGSAPAPQAAVSARPKTKEEAAALVAIAASVMRGESPTDPSPYLLIRGLRWGEIRAGGEHVDPRWLTPPTTEQRTHLKGLFLDNKHEELLGAVEGIMGTAAGRGWLDLQRYAVLATDRMGSDFQLVGKAIRGALQSLLMDLPSLIDATLMDDSPTASRDTMAWLGEEGLLPDTGAAAAAAAEGQTKRADRVIKESGYERARAMARAGDTQGAIEMLMERAEHERSARARFITKAEAAGIMVANGMAVVARPILDELIALIDQHSLEVWEAAEVVAKPMGLLIQCLDAREAPIRAKVYPRLAKLDPVLAMEVSQPATGGAQAARPAQPQAPPASQQSPQAQYQPPPGPHQSPPPEENGADGEGVANG
jgi:type VI secretion system protein ImpA